MGIRDARRLRDLLFRLLVRKMSSPFLEPLVYDLFPKNTVLGGVDPGLRRGREAPPEGPDSAELVREVVPVGVVGVGVVAVVGVVGVDVDVDVDEGVKFANLLGTKFEGLVKCVAKGLLWSTMRSGVLDPPR